MKMKPEIIDTCPAPPGPATDVNNNVKTSSIQEIKRAQDKAAQPSPLRYFPGTVEDLMNGNYNVLVQRGIGSGYGGSVYRCVVYHEDSDPKLQHSRSDPGEPAGVRGSKSRESSSVVALKVLLKDRTKAKVAINEVKLLMAARAPNVLTYLTSMETTDSYWILTELCGQGDLHGMLRDLDNFDIFTRIYMRDVIAGLQSLHAKFIAHCDIKMKNILITDKNVAKIADFGFAKQYDSEDAVETVCNGTRDYWAPEMWDDRPSFSPFLADTYALGVTFAGVCERRPIKLKNDDIHKIVNRFRDQHKMALFRGLLSNYTDRWSLQKARSNFWLNEYTSPTGSPE